MYRFLQEQFYFTLFYLLKKRIIEKNLKLADLCILSVCKNYVLNINNCNLLYVIQALILIFF